MGLWLATKAFWKALCDSEAARAFVQPGTEVAAPAVEEEVQTTHLRLLAALQRTGRLVDFLQEEIEGFEDEQVGAAVREVHRSCRQCLDELVALRPVLEEREGAEIRITKGYDASRIKVIGQVPGEPPYTAYVVHRGWQARKKSLPQVDKATATTTVVAPAEVEVR